MKQRKSKRKESILASARGKSHLSTDFCSVACCICFCVHNRQINNSDSRTHGLFFNTRTTKCNKGKSKLQCEENRSTELLIRITTHESGPDAHIWACCFGTRAKVSRGDEEERLKSVFGCWKINSRYIWLKSKQRHSWETSTRQGKCCWESKGLLLHQH